MPPIGQEENPWVVMHEYTVSRGCRVPDLGDEDTASSSSSLTFEGSNSSAEYVTTNELSPGNRREALPQNVNRLPSSHAKANGGQESTPRSLNQISSETLSRSPPTPIDLHTRAPRNFEDFDGSDLQRLFPDFFKGNSPFEVAEWVERCKCSGAGLPLMVDSARDEPIAAGRRNDNMLRESEKEDRENNEQYDSDLSDRPGSVIRQNNTQNQDRTGRPESESEEEAKEGEDDK